MSINDGGPAFPRPASDYAGDFKTSDPIPAGRISPQRGMSLRDYFAAKAMPALITSMKPEYIAEEAYRIADLMIYERSKGTK